jgi:hypothetical protein
MHTQKPCSGGTIELNHIVYIPTTAVYTIFALGRAQCKPETGPLVYPQNIPEY